MTLEANKIYKIVHPRTFFASNFPRDYIICCPIRDYCIDDSRIKKASSSLNSLCKVDCVFTIDFFGDAAPNIGTSFFEDCHLEPLNDNDILDVKKAMDKRIVKDYIYNRKLNMLVKKNDTKG